ncbi:HEPN domain-containing protein [Arthrospiribacter ruber]|uniref:ApeA N-terminal domain-containing protein n=1 Tax=Arthrospiribacter ruber TaxID=2487934 RepID=A0A951J741_9BACT|nr:HEPN domain-containing protein [Arthrospiribacter ruber]MBW3470448.1 hypothetical protein [Arthrospiribacter ruber]
MKYNKNYKGEFFIAGEDKNIVFGVLKFLNGTAYIDLFGHFYSRKNHKSTVEIIYGHLDNGESCIFCNCTLKPPHPFHRTNFVNFDYFIYAPTHIITRDSGKKIEFNAINFRLDYLTSWTGLDFFESFYEGDKIAGVKRIVQNLDDLILYNDDNYELRITHAHTVPIINPYSNYTLEQESWLYCDLKGTLNFHEIFDFLLEIEQLFILMMGTNTVITTPITLYSTEEKSHYCYRNTRNVRFEPLNNSESNPLTHEFFIDLNSLKDQTELKSFFESWKKVRLKYEYSVLKIVESLSNTSKNHESTFLNLVFALEKLIEKDMPSKNDVKELSNKDERHIAILERENIPKNTINYLKAKIKKVNRRTLKDKVSDYLKEYEKHSLELWKLDYDLFINKLVDSRNHLAHLCNKCEYRMELKEYPNFNRGLLKILLVILFNKLGIGSEYTMKVVNRNQLLELKEK